MSGLISAKNIYQVLINAFDSQVDNSWFKQWWKWPIQLKIKLFVWLAAKDKVLTWESLQRKGWQGPGLCTLCNCSSETINHLLIHCAFMKSVWLHLFDLYRVKTRWAGNSVLHCFMEWTKDKSAPTSLAATTRWHVWTERNKALFEECSPSYRAVVYRISGTFSWQPAIPKSIPIRVCDFTLTEGFTLACFDGAALGVLWSRWFFQDACDKDYQMVLKLRSWHQHKGGALGIVGNSHLGYALVD